jgi:hypothetical protein
VSCLHHFGATACYRLSETLRAASSDPAQIHAWLLRLDAWECNVAARLWRHQGRAEDHVSDDPAKLFTAIYKTHYWADDESRSGGGSNLYATEKIRGAIPGLLAKYGFAQYLIFRVVISSGSKK